MPRSRAPELSGRAELRRDQHGQLYCSATDRVDRPTAHADSGVCVATDSLAQAILAVLLGTVGCTASAAPPPPPPTPPGLCTVQATSGVWDGKGQSFVEMPIHTYEGGKFINVCKCADGVLRSCQ